MMIERRQFLQNVESAVVCCMAGGGCLDAPVNAQMRAAKLQAALKADGVELTDPMNHPPTIQRSKKDKPMKHKTCIGVRIFALLTPAAMAMAQGELAQIRQDFSTDPGWDGVTNRVQAKPHPVVQDFGYGRVTLEGESATLDFAPGVKSQGITLDRFGLFTWRPDGNSNDVFFDDLTYTSAAPKTSGAIEVKSGVAQLFVDDFIIGAQTNLKRTLHQPKKDSGGNVPVLAFDKEYGDYRSTLEANGTVIFDTRLKKYVMFGIGYSSHHPGPASEKIRIYRFTSPDAMNWIKGDNGTPQRISFDLTDAASGTSAKNTDLFSYYYDTKDAAHPYKGWLHFSNWSDGREGIYYVRSPDGIAWERVRQITSSGSREIQQDEHTFLGPGDVTTFYHDPVTDRFIGSLRFSSREGVGPGNKNRLRAKAFLWLDRMDEPVDLKRIDHLDLVPAGAAANGDLPDDEYYSATTWRHESLWLGGLKVWHGGGDYPWSAAGSAFLKLIVSRDGVQWKKVPFLNEAGQPEVFIANGPEGGNNGQNDGGYITEVTNAPLRIGNELIYYYGCSSYGKNHPNETRVSGGGIFRARLRPDGFVSVDGGTLTTKPLRFDGKDLFVNGSGPITVTVLDAAEKSLGSATVSGDSLRHRLSFTGKSLRELAPGSVMRLRFTVSENAHLYSFTVH